MAEEDEGQETQNQETNEGTTTSAADANTEGSQEQNGDVPYERFQQVIEEKNEYKNELEELKDQLDEMEDPEDVKKEYETKLEKMQKQSTGREKEFALKEAALKEGVNKDALDDFAKVADLDELEITDDGKVEGVGNLLDTMKEEKSYYFSEDEGSVNSAGDQFSESGENEETDEALREAMGL